MVGVTLLSAAVSLAQGGSSWLLISDSYYSNQIDGGWQTHDTGVCPVPENHNWSWSYNDIFQCDGYAANPSPTWTGNFETLVTRIVPRTSNYSYFCPAMVVWKVDRKEVADITGGTRAYLYTGGAPFPPTSVASRTWVDAVTTVHWRFSLLTPGEGGPGGGPGLD